MAWGTPVIHATGDVVTASDWNINSNDIILLSEGTGAEVATQETTTTTASYVDLATVGPTVTLTTGASAIVFISTLAVNSVANSFCAMAFAVSGASTVPASDAQNCQVISASTTVGNSGAAHYFVAGLTAGSNTFTAKYKAQANTATFLRRSLCVIPLP